MSTWSSCSFKRVFKTSPFRTFAFVVCVTGVCLCILSFTRFDTMKHMKLLADQQIFVLEVSDNDKQIYQEPQLIEIARQTKPKVRERKTVVTESTITAEVGKTPLIKSDKDRPKKLSELEEDIHQIKEDKGTSTSSSKNSSREIKNDKGGGTTGQPLKYKEPISSNKTIRKAAKMPSIPQNKFEKKLRQSKSQKGGSQELQKERSWTRKMRQISMEEALSKFRYKASKECINECPRTKTDDNPLSYSSLCNFATQARWSGTLQQAEVELTPFLEEDEYVYSYEREYLSYPKASDPSYLPSAKRSRVVFQRAANPGRVSTVTCRLGETVSARLDVLDGAGRRRTTGGDEVRAWVGATHAYNGSKIYSMYPRCMAPVTDLNNGSYRIDVRCLWAGRSRLVVTLRYPREFLKMVVETVRNGGSRFLGARFQNGAAKEEVPCLATPNIPGRPCICNMTRLNGGAPFYCARPLDSRLTCNDWVVSGTMTRVTPADFAAAEGKFAMKRQESLVPTDNLEIVTEPTVSADNEQSGKRPADSDKEGNQGLETDSPKLQLFMPSASEPCKGTNPKITWTTKRPTGYWLDTYHTWVSLLCKEPTLTTPFMQACLKDSSVWIMGDSNGVRLYYKVADSTGLARLDYGPMPFFDALAHSNRHENITVQFSPHEHPLYVTKEWKQLDVGFIGVPDKIDAIPSKGRQFLIIHYYLHLTTVHLGVAHDRFVAARDAIIRLLARNPQAVVAIRGPHTVSLNAEYDIAIGGDSLVRYFIAIIREVFEDLQDRVLFLDGWETSLSVESAGIHPMGAVAEEMTRKFFSFVCAEDVVDNMNKL